MLCEMIASHYIRHKEVEIVTRTSPRSGLFLEVIDSEVVARRCRLAFWVATQRQLPGVSRPTSTFTDLRHS